MSGKHLNDISKVYLDTIANVKKAETDADIKRWEDLGGPTPGNYRADDNSAKLKEGRRLRKSDWREDLREVINRPETEEKAEKKVDEKKVKNKVVINPSFKEAIEEIGGELLEVTEMDDVQKKQDDTQAKQAAHKKQLEAKQKKVAAMKKIVLRKKMQAVATGAGEDITAGYEPEGEVIAEKDLNAAERRALPNKDFVFPGKGEGPEGKQRGAYPINDKKHARNALAMAAAHASPEKEAKVKAAVKKKYPEIEVSEGWDKVAKQLGRIAVKKLKSKKVKKAIYKKGKEIVKKGGGAGVEGAVDAATERAREAGGNIVRDAGKKKEVTEDKVLKTIAKELDGASKMHKGQANKIKSHIKDMKTEEKKPKNCGCGQDPCITYGKKKEVDEGVISTLVKPKKKVEKKAEKAMDAGSRLRRKVERRVHAKYVSGSEDNVPDDIREEDKAYNYVLAKLKAKHGSGVLTKGDKMPEPSAAQKKKNAEIMAKRAKEDGRDATEKASSGRYSDRYSNRGSD